MMRRPRRPTDEREFEDPLRNYAQPEYADDFERFLSLSQIGEMQIAPFFAVDAATPVSRVLTDMAQHPWYCALVTEADRLVGIFSERDVLNRVGGEYESVKDRPIRDLITPNPVTVYATDPPAKALNLMAHGGFRHVPVLDTADWPIGVLGPRQVAKLLQPEDS